MKVLDIGKFMDTLAQLKELNPDKSIRFDQDALGLYFIDVNEEEIILPEDFDSEMFAFHICR